MEKFCPLCRKGGLNSKLSVCPLNENESIELCENKQCIWPFGYEPFKIIPKPDKDLEELLEKHKNTPIIPISTELSLYTPPVTPEDNQETKTNVKGTTDSYASPATIVKESQIFADHSPSIFDIDSPKKAAETSQLVQGCDKILGISVSNPVEVLMKNKPTVKGNETIKNKIFRIKSNSNLDNQPNVRILKKVIFKKSVNPPAKCLINHANVNMSVKTHLNTNGNSLKLPNNISDNNKLQSLLDSNQVKDNVSHHSSQNNLDSTGKNIYTVDLSVISEDSLANTPGDSNPSMDVSLIKEEDIKRDLDSIMENFESSNTTNHQMNIDDEWLNSLLM